jgi:hypothetical protein
MSRRIVAYPGFSMNRQDGTLEPRRIHEWNLSGEEESSKDLTAITTESYKS